MKVIPVPAFTDNYIWLFHSENTNQAYVVDPGDAAVVEKALTENNLELKGILITHHHFDHTGGIEELINTHNVPVYSGLSSKVAGITHYIADGDTITLSPDITFQILDIPGHTLDHVGFYCAEHSTLFSGDTLFVGGCGRLFEGTATQMYNSLEKLSNLPNDTQVYCAHEYTKANLDFASAVEPDNNDISAKIKWVKQKRERQEPTVPTTIESENLTNPFLRSTAPTVISAAKSRSQMSHMLPDQVLAEIRRWKDSY